MCVVRLCVSEPCYSDFNILGKSVLESLSLFFFFFFFPTLLLHSLTASVSLDCNPCEDALSAAGLKADLGWYSGAEVRDYNKV